MATAHMPDEFHDAVAHDLPPEQPVGPRGGRPRIDHRTALRVIWVVLAAGTREDVPKVRYDRLGVSMDAWTTLAASVICFRILHHDTIKNLSFVRAFYLERSPEERARARPIGNLVATRTTAGYNSPMPGDGAL